MTEDQKKLVNFILKGDENALEKFLKLKKVNPNFDGFTDESEEFYFGSPMQLALEFSPEGKEIIMAKLLLKYNADVNYTNKYGEMAIYHVPDKFYKFLLENKADVNGGIFAEQPALIAFGIENPNLEDAKFLLENKGNVNIRDANGETALINAAIYGAESDYINLLLKYGSDPNMVDKNGYTALMVASKNGRTEVVKELLKSKNINVNFKLKGNTAYSITKNKEVKNILKPYVDFIEKIPDNLQLKNEEKQINDLFFKILPELNFGGENLKNIFVREIYNDSNKNIIQFSGNEEDFYNSIKIILSGKSNLPIEELDAYLNLLIENLEGVKGFLENYPDEFKNIMNKEEYKKLKELCNKRKDYTSDIRNFMNENKKYANIQEYVHAMKIIEMREELMNMYCVLNK